jgi:hypothetical protein
VDWSGRGYLSRRVRTDGIPPGSGAPQRAETSAGTTHQEADVAPRSKETEPLLAGLPSAVGVSRGQACDLTGIAAGRDEGGAASTLLPVDLDHEVVSLRRDRVGLGYVGPFDPFVGWCRLDLRHEAPTGLDADRIAPRA